MDVLALLDLVREDECAITTLPRIVAAKKTLKRLRVKGSTHDTKLRQLSPLTQQALQSIALILLRSRLEQVVENNWLKVKESSWEEKLKSQEQRHLSELECLCQSSEDALRKYQEDKKKNLTEALPILRSNLVLHVEVVVGPLNLSRVNFNYLQKVTPNFLNFNIYNLEGKD
ncbi:hypothetical protein PVK06_038919 [Gossypium arboreum]|uniref:Uncharacterized protein n=1 Tax=Gossypium arboreum TaxID=29729 RepID=A0ABR0N1G6_GOSAR|nr:hypothetical protein PVK06_038919 [Gossypium arboreum]